jgi:hypothetical protein
VFRQKETPFLNRSLVTSAYLSGNGLVAFKVEKKVTKNKPEVIVKSKVAKFAVQVLRSQLFASSIRTDFAIN